MNLEFEIAGRKIGREHPPYIIAEMSANHLQDFDRAQKILEAAAKSGADALKLQTYRPDTITIDAHGPGFDIKGGLWDGRSLFELYNSSYMPWDWHEPLMELGHKLGITVFSSPFDQSAVGLLSSLNAPAYKIASFECIDHALVKSVADQQKPVILSSGLANIEEIFETLAVLQASGNKDLAILHCVSGYPTPIDECNIMTVADLGSRFPNLVVGLSDHSFGTVVATTAIALGASIIEKHVTLSRADGGPDAAFSLEPNELAQLVSDCRNAWSAIGRVHYDLKPSEQNNLQFRRSLYVVEDIAKGESFTNKNIRSIRPGFGLEPNKICVFLGKSASRPLSRGEPVSLDMIDNH